MTLVQLSDGRGAEHIDIFEKTREKVLPPFWCIFLCFSHVMGTAVAKFCQNEFIAL